MADPQMPNASQPDGWNDDDWEGLLLSIRQKDCTPFLGAGACAGVLPLGSEIAAEWADEYDYPFQDTHNLVRVAQYVSINGWANTPKRKIRDKFSGKLPDFNNPNEPHRVVADLHLPVYITTNYDDFMMKALERDFPKRTPRRELEEAKRWADRANTEGYAVSNSLLQFIQASQSHIEERLRRQRNLSVVITTIAIASTVAVIILSIMIFTLRDSTEIIKRAEEKGFYAGYLSDIPPCEFYSLRLALSAFDINIPPEKAVEGLRKAITVVGNSTWLTGLVDGTRITGAKLSADGAYAVAYSDRRLAYGKLIREGRHSLKLRRRKLRINMSLPS